MAILACRADGNFTDAATWAVVNTADIAGPDATYIDVESISGSIQTTEASNRSSSGFTPGAITIDGIGLKLSSRTLASGTFSVQLWNYTDTIAVTGTSVTIDVADFPNTPTTSDKAGIWMFFKFAAPVTLEAGKSYNVSMVTSVASTVSLHLENTLNWSRYLRTTTTQAPAAGDDLIITREFTAPGASTPRTVTMNSTTATDYGSARTAANSLLTPAIIITTGGSLIFGTAAATNYYLKSSGSIIVCHTGTLAIGTVATPMPRDSTAVLEFDPAADGDYGLICRNGSIVTLQGLSRTSGKNIVSCKLNTDEAVASTSLDVDTDTGWLDNDEIAVASTTRTFGESEFNRLNGNASSTTLTVDGGGGAGGGVAFAHSGTSPTQAEVILLTRNVKVRGAVSTLMAFVQINDGASVDSDWVEFYWLGEAQTGKRGIEYNYLFGNNPMNLSFQYCSMHDFEDNGFYVGQHTTTITNFIFSNNVMWNCSSVSGGAVTLAQALTATNWTIDNNIVMRVTAGFGYQLSDVGGVFTNNSAISVTGGSGGFLVGESGGGVIGTFNNNTAHSCAAPGIIFSGTVAGIMSNCKIWRCNGVGMSVSGCSGLTLPSLTIFGCGVGNMTISTGTDITFIDPVLGSDTTFTSPYNIQLATSTINIVRIFNGNLSPTVGIITPATTDIAHNTFWTSDPQWIFNNTFFGAATEFVLAMTNIFHENAFISSQNHDQIAGNHKVWLRGGILTSDTTIFNTASPSLRMTPANTTIKCISAPRFQGIKAAVASGNTATISAYVRKSVVGDGAAYNGNEPRLILRMNPAAGIFIDTVIDTAAAAAGSWEQLTGTTAAVTSDNVLEFYIDCDGTAGWVNVDDWSVT